MGGTFDMFSQQKEIAQLEAEIARLRAELSLIRSISPATSYTGACETCTAMRDTARLALEVTQ